MRSVALVLVMLGIASCKYWRVDSPFELAAAPIGPMTEHILIVMKSNLAFELDDVKVTEQRVAGTIVGTWKVSPDPIDPDGLGELDADQVAQVLGWQSIKAPAEAASFEAAEIRYSRVYARSTARIVGGGLATVSLGLALLLAMLLSHQQSGTGRPLRVRGRATVTPVAEGSAWAEPIALAPVDAGVRARLAEIWTREAQAEHASIAAFSKLSLELLALGAPPDLVARANRAALQEVQHARLCFAVASAYAGRALGPAPLAGALEGDTIDLARVAREALLDGCVGEGVSAEIARLGASSARDPAIARVMRIQATEETQHAALAWAIVEWCLERGGEALRAELVAALGSAPLPRGADLPEHGRVAHAVVARLHRETIEHSADRLRGALARRSGESRG